MEVDNNLEEFVIQEKRHREVIRAIKSIMEDMPETKIDLSALDNLKDSITAVLSKNTEPVSDLKLVQSIQDLGLKIEENINSLKELIIEQNKPKEYSFDIERSKANNFIKKVNVIVK
jgi:hypothetical protein